MLKGRIDVYAPPVVVGREGPGDAEDVPLGLEWLEVRVSSPSGQVSGTRWAGEVIEGEVPHMNLVLHDPTTGSEKSRVKLPAPAVDTDWDAPGTHLLFTDSDRVHFFSAGQFGDIPGLNDVHAVAW